MSEKTGERTRGIIGCPLHTMPSGGIIGFLAKRTIVERQDISTRREELIEALSQELSIIHTDRLGNRTRRKGKEAVKPENEQKLQAFAARAIGSCNKQSRKWKKSNYLRHVRLMAGSVTSSLIAN